MALFVSRCAQNRNGHGSALRLCSGQALGLRSGRASVGSRVVALCVTLAAYALIGSFVIDVRAGQSRTVSEGIYSDGQATRGQIIFKERCAVCHGAALEGSVGPPLVGAEFMGDFNKLPLSELFNKIQKTMPQDDPGTLQPPQTADLVAFILKSNKFPAGRADLGIDEAVLKSIGWPAAANAVADARPPATGISGQVPTWALTGNLIQVMRGILFPSSNVIFNVQTHDPDEKRGPGYDPGTGAVSWVEWGAGIYSGWDIVDNAAVSIAEAAPLLLTPGRRCQNGRPVPVDRPDWIKYTMDMVQAARLAYKASQSRSQEAVSDATNDLADACLACHQVYRDKRGAGTPGDTASLALRCTP